MEKSLSSVRLEFRLFSTQEMEQEVFDRQSRIPGFSQKNLGSAVVTLIGAGGLGGEIARRIDKKGDREDADL